MPIPMSARESVVRAARRTNNSTSLEVVTRAGFLGYGIFHLVVGWLALQLALGNATGESDQSGAFEFLASQPYGRVLLVAIVVGLVAMAVWQLLLAAVGHRDERGHRRTFERLASAGRAVIYGALAYTAGKVVVGAHPSSESQQRNATEGLLSQPAGRTLVAIAGLAVLAIGIGMVVYGARRDFEKRLMISRMSGRTRTTAVRLGQVGYVAKGVAFGIVGLLVAVAALRRDASRSGGLDPALRTLAGRPYGELLLVLDRRRLRSLRGVLLLPGQVPEGVTWTPPRSPVRRAGQPDQGQRRSRAARGHPRRAGRGRLAGAGAVAGHHRAGHRARARRGRPSRRASTSSSSTAATALCGRRSARWPARPWRSRCCRPVPETCSPPTSGCPAASTSRWPAATDGAGGGGSMWGRPARSCSR